MTTYHSGNLDQSKHPFRMLASANIDKLMITVYHYPYTRTNTYTCPKFENTTRDSSRLPLLLLRSFPVDSYKHARD